MQGSAFAPVFDVKVTLIVFYVFALFRYLLPIVYLFLPLQDSKTFFFFFCLFHQVLSALDILQPPHVDYFEEMYPVCIMNKYSTSVHTS